MKFVQSACVLAAVFGLGGPALAAEAPATLHQWQLQMRQASREMEEGNLPSSQRNFEDALKCAKAVENVDAQFLSMLHLGVSLELQGRYADAEQQYKRAAELPCGEPAYEFLAFALEKQGRMEEAAVIHKAHHMTDAEQKAFTALYARVHAAIDKAWGPLRAAGPNGSGTSSFAFAEFLLPPSTSQKAVFISSSSGDTALDTECLQAFENTGLPNDKPVHGSAQIARLRFGGYKINVNIGYQLTVTSAEQADLTEHEYRLVHRKLQAQEKLLGPAHLECACTMVEAADHLQALGKTQEAAAAYKHAIANFDAAKYQGAQCLQALTGLGEALIAQKDYSEAEVVLQRAQKLRIESYNPNAYLPKNPTPLLAKALTKLHRGDEAKQLLSAGGSK